jgi:hypothetical protein
MHSQSDFEHGGSTMIFARDMMESVCIGIVVETEQVGYNTVERIQSRLHFGSNIIVERIFRIERLC